MNTPTITEAEEIAAAVTALGERVGERANLSLQFRFDNGGPSIACWLYPRGVGMSDSIHKSGKDWRAVLAEVQGEWEGRAALMAERTIEAMALEIIKIAYASGGCTDAQLRGGAFTATEVNTFGVQAVERANLMAEGGPFVLVIQRAANDAGEDEQVAA